MARPPRNVSRASRTARVLAAAVAVALLAGCGGSSKRDPDRNRYACDGGQSFSAELRPGASEVWVRLADHSFRMNRVETEAGDTYTRGGNTLSVSEGVATLKLGDGSEMKNCRLPGKT